MFLTAQGKLGLKIRNNKKEKCYTNGGGGGAEEGQKSVTYDLNDPLVLHLAESIKNVN
jgi:hypothetical protein